MGKTALGENLEAPKVTSASEELEQPESHTLLRLRVLGWPCDCALSNDVEGPETLDPHFLLCPLLLIVQCIRGR